MSPPGTSSPPILTCHASQRAAWAQRRQGRLRRREAGMRLDGAEPMRRNPGKTFKAFSEHSLATSPHPHTPPRLISGVPASTPAA